MLNLFCTFDPRFKINELAFITLNKWTSQNVVSKIDKTFSLKTFIGLLCVRRAVATCTHRTDYMYAKVSSQRREKINKLWEVIRRRSRIYEKKQKKKRENRHSIMWWSRKHTNQLHLLSDNILYYSSIAYISMDSKSNKYIKHISHIDTYQ